MNPMRRFLIPAGCFVVAWTIARLLTGHDETPVPPTAAMAPTKAQRERPDARKVTAEKLAADFRTRPMNEWAALWDAFAREATEEDLQRLPLLFPERRDGRRIQGDNLLHALALEELAVRGDEETGLSPGSLSALAESNPAAAWERLATNHRHDYATAALRTLAAKDPMAALKRFQAMPPGGRGPVDEGRRAAVWHTPVGAVFGAWARRDPEAAAAAAMELPPEDRTQAANHIAMTWSFRDGPAAIRYLLDFDRSGEGFTSRHLRLDVVLRASFRTHPAETAALMDESAMLRKVIGSPPNLYVALKPWFDTDPEAALAWLSEAAPRPREDAIYWLSEDADPAAAKALLRKIAGLQPGACRQLLTKLYRRNPDQALSLADEIGIPLRDDPLFERHRLRDHPAEACDRWLAALREHGDPATALAAFGWTGEQACELAARAARVFPEKAAALAKLVPASSLDATNLWRRNNEEIVRFWPELKPALKYPSSEPAGPAFPEHRFRYDPAAAAAMLAESDGIDAAKVIERWAPHDLPAARDWLAGLPDIPARRSGELALAKIQARSDPVATLEILKSADESATGQLWESTLRHLMQAGGDWQAWLAEVPESRREWIADRLSGEARVIGAARRHGRR